MWFDFQILRDSLDTSMLLTSNVTLWLENIFCITLIFKDLLRPVLFQKIWSILVKVLSI